MGLLPDVFRDSLITLRNKTPSGLLAKRNTELKIFNNVYTQRAFYNSESKRTELEQRNSWYTGLIRFQHGITHRFEAGLDVHYRRVRYGRVDENLLLLFSSDHDSVQRSGISRVGANFRWQVFPQLNYFSARLSFLVSVLSQNDLKADGPFLDSDSNIGSLEFLLDKEIGLDLWVYASLNNLLEINNIGGELFYRSPFSLVGSYRKFEYLSPYVLIDLVPSWGRGEISSYYIQIGTGLKLYPREDMELEVLYSKFVSGKNSGAGQTFNLGLRRVF